MKQLNHTQVLEERFLPSLFTLGTGLLTSPCIFQTIRRRYTDDE